MIAIHINKVLEIQNKFCNEINAQRVDALGRLENIERQQFEEQEIRYLDRVINLFRDERNNILSFKPQKIQEIISNTFYILPNDNKNLKDSIINALGYDKLRSMFYPKYFKELGINTCVYCNSQLTIVARKDSKKSLVAKFQVDHYYPKSTYPFLSISLFNLYPVCASCNNIKSNNVVDFELYSENESEVNSSLFKFKLAPDSCVKYLTSKDKDSIKILFEEPNTRENLKSFNQTFHIEGIYDTQTDLVEELIIKSQIYNKSYLKTLESSFNKLALNSSLFKRTIVGNYTEPKDIHKRPMSKLVMDIAKELGLI